MGTPVQHFFLYLLALVESISGSIELFRFEKAIRLVIEPRNRFDCGWGLGRLRAGDRKDKHSCES